MVLLSRLRSRVGLLGKFAFASLLPILALGFVLAHVLRHLPPATDPNVLVGAATSDDAAVYRLTPELEKLPEEWKFYVR